MGLPFSRSSQVIPALATRASTSTSLVWESDATHSQVLNLGPDALALLTEITHREPRLASRRVEELHELLEGHGDDMMREAIGRAVRAATLTVAAVKRALSKMGARRRDGFRHRVVAAQPRGQDGRQLTLAVVRADAKRGAP